MSLSRLQTRSYPSWAVNTCLTTCTVHIGPLCVGFCLQRNLADLIEGACRLPTPPPIVQLSDYLQTWQAIRKPDKARWVAFKFCTRPGHLASGLQRWVGLSLDFPFLVVVEYERLCNSSLWWNNIYSPASFTLFAHLCDMIRQCKLVFVLPFRRCP